MNENYMRISELVERSGVPRTTIHFYLREGLLHPPMKTGRTMAYYNESHLRRLQLINKLKLENHLPVAMVKERLAEFDGGEASVRSVSYDSTNPVDMKAEVPHNDKRKQIINAAIEIFSQKGYHRAKIQDITRSVGISTGTFYIYFNNKQDLFIEVIDDVLRTIIHDEVKSLRNEDDFFKRLEIRGKAFYKNYLKYDEILYQLRAEMASEDDWPQNRVKKAYRDITEPVIRELENALNQGILRPIDPELLAYALTGMIEILSLRLKLDNRYTYDEIESFILDFLSRRLKP